MHQDVAATATAERWVCDRCGLCVRQSDGKQTRIPDNWEASAEGQFCLVCRRKRAGEAALEDAPDPMTPDARARLRRDAVLEFEVSRTPERSNGEIARVCRSSVPAVADARRRLELTDPPQPA